MGLLDLASSVLVSFKADTGDLKAGIKNLQGAEKELAEQQLAAADARNKQFEDWKKGLDAMLPQLEAIKKAFEFAWDAMKTKQHEVRQEFAATGIDIERLSASFGGLKTHMEVLEFAARNNQSAFRLNSQELNIVAQATRTLTERGFDAAEAQERLTNALVTGKSKGLEQYGIVMHGLGDTMTLAGDHMGTFSKKASTASEILQQLVPIAAEAGKGIGTYGEEADRAAVKFHDSWENVKIAMASLGESLVPLVESLGKAVGYIAKIAKWGQKDSDCSVTGDIRNGVFNASLATYEDASNEWGFGWGSGRVKGALGGLKKQVTEQKADEAQRDFSVALDRTTNMFMDEMRSIGAIAEDKFSSTVTELHTYAVEKANKAREEAAAAWKEQHKKLLELLAKQVSEDGDALIKRLEAEQAKHREERQFGSPDTSFLDDKGGDVLGPLAGRGNYGIARGSVLEALGGKVTYGSLGEVDVPGIQEQLAGGARGPQGDAFHQDQLFGQFEKQMGPVWEKEYYASKEKGLEKVFGPVGDFDLYKKAFEGITQAVGQSFGAWIDGSESASKAFKKFIAESIKAVAVQAAIESLKEGAWALGELAFGDPAKAALHGLAAAKFAAVAVVAGAAAHELGGGGSGATAASAGGGVPPGRGAGGAGASSAPTGPIIVYGDSFADDSPRMRQAKAKKWVTEGLGGAGGSYGGGY